MAKVLHITTIDSGGAFKGAWRLCDSLNGYGIDSQVMVRTRKEMQKEVLNAFPNPMLSALSKGKNGINKLFARGEISRDLMGTDLSHNEHVMQADVVVLHWVNSFLSIGDVIRLSKLGKKMIWVMHDMWLFTGGCHYDNYCGKYVAKCGNCPLASMKKEIDISRKNYYDKEKMMEELKISITGPSEWLVNCAKMSNILKKKDVYYVPNTLNTKIYFPREDRSILRREFGLNRSKKIILFGAADNGINNEIKGFRYLREAFNYLATEDYSLIILGDSGNDLMLPAELEVVRMGYITDESIIIKLYNIADVIVAPSNQETFGYTVCEAMACGTPAVCFPVGGLKEQVLHKENGYLANYHDSEDLARGIKYCTEHTEDLGKMARKAAMKYSYENVGKVFAQLCK